MLFHIFFCRYIPHLNWSKFKLSANTYESERKYSVDQEIEFEIIIFWLKNIYLLKKLKKLKSSLGETKTRKIHTSCQV